MAKANVGFCHFVFSKEAQAAVRDAESENLSEILTNLSVEASLESSLEEDLEASGIMGGWHEYQSEEF